MSKQSDIRTWTSPTPHGRSQTQSHHDERQQTPRRRRIVESDTSVEEQPYMRRYQSDQPHTVRNGGAAAIDLRHEVVEVNDSHSEEMYILLPEQPHNDENASPHRRRPAVAAVSTRNTPRRSSSNRRSRSRFEGEAEQSLNDDDGGSDECDENEPNAQVRKCNKNNIFTPFR